MECCRFVRPSRVRPSTGWKRRGIKCPRMWVVGWHFYIWIQNLYFQLSCADQINHNEIASRRVLGRKISSYAWGTPSMWSTLHSISRNVSHRFIFHWGGNARFYAWRFIKFLKNANGEWKLDFHAEQVGKLEREWKAFNCFLKLMQKLLNQKKFFSCHALLYAI